MSATQRKRKVAWMTGRQKAIQKKHREFEFDAIIRRSIQETDWRAPLPPSDFWPTALRLVAPVLR